MICNYNNIQYTYINMKFNKANIHYTVMANVQK